MTADEWKRIKAVFDELVELPSAQWRPELDRRVADDPALRAEVERLLGLHARAGGFLESIPTVAEALRQPADEAPRIFDTGDVAAGRFRIAGLLGRGGMGEVYEAWDETAKTRVALKTIRGSLASQRRIEERFRREVELSRQVTHPNVCRVYDLFVHQPDPGAPGPGILLLSMELLTGENLSERIRRAGPIAQEEARAIVEQVAAALEAAHAVGVIHRDLKGSNVMLVRAADLRIRAVVTDFGLAQPVSGAEQAEGERFHAGTPAYMSPEQGRGGPATPASDIYSFGVLMYEMVTGRLPFPDARAGAPRRAPAPPSEVRAGLDPRWDTVISRCLEENARRRFATPAAIVAALSPDDGGFGGRRKLLSLAAAVAGSAIAGAELLRPLPAGFNGALSLPAPQSIAVLPFASTAGDEALAVTASGLADELINRLSQVRALRVAAASSSSRCPPDADAAVVRARLGVNAALRGAVRSDGVRTYLNVQLIDLGRRSVIWGESYDRDRAGLALLPAQVARSVAEALGVALSPPQATAMTSRQTENPEAFEWYLLGRRAALTRTAQGLERSIECFDRALALDGGYAQALSEKAASLVTLAGYPGHPPEPPLREAQGIAAAAVRLMPDLAEAHVSLGAVQQRLYWNWEEALREFRIARDRQPGLAVARLRLGGLLSNLGRSREAIAELAAARDLDPLSAPVHTALGAAFLRAGRGGEAIRQLELTLQIEPDYLNAEYLLAQAYALDGRHEQALAAAGRLLKKQPDSPLYQCLRAYVLASGGNAVEALAILAELEAQWQKKYFPPYAIAQAYTGLNQQQKVLDWLDRSWQTRDPSLVILKVDPLMAAVRDRPEYQELVRRLRL